MYSIVASCAPRHVPDNGRVSYSGGDLTSGRYPVGTTARYFCDEGYHPTGASTSACTTNGWSNLAISCEGDGNVIVTCR